MKIIPEASNMVILEISDWNDRVLGVFEVRTITGQGLEIRVIKKVPTKKGYKIEQIRVKRDDLGVQLS